ncbi:MAG: hypothetical protein H8E38_03885 [SAR324 cluster bacterium]|nr:hypothetical protein [SAR324 cluster bacterium]MBL7035909.1 hypothetical protein [SAR324 cluster bacterium]
MDISNEQINEAMAKILVHRYEKAVGVPILESDILLTEDMFKRIETHDSAFLG